MKLGRKLPVLSILLLSVFLSAGARGSSGHKESTHGEEHGDTMRAQHERMANFKEAADMVGNGIIHSAPKMVLEGAEKLRQSLEGHERDVPHKNRRQEKEFQRLYVELGKRTQKLNAAVKAGDLPRSAVEYGRLLEVCATCHKKFRD